MLWFEQTYLISESFPLPMKKKEFTGGQKNSMKLSESISDLNSLEFFLISLHLNHLVNQWCSRGGCCAEVYFLRFLLENLEK